MAFLVPAPAGALRKETLDGGRDLLHGCVSPLGFTSRAPLGLLARDPLRLGLCVVRPHASSGEGAVPGLVLPSLITQCDSEARCRSLPHPYAVIWAQGNCPPGLREKSAPTFVCTLAFPNQRRRGNVS